MNKNNLKIELRAVPYSSDSHILEYRISPEQDLHYVKEISLLGGLIKFNFRCKYSTKWNEIWLFMNMSTSYLYDESEDFHWMPIFVNSKRDLDVWKSKFRTYGDLSEYISKYNEKEYTEYIAERKKYLDSRGTWT